MNECGLWSAIVDQISFSRIIKYIFCSFIKRWCIHVNFFQVQKLTDNIQFILETVMMSTVVEVQVMFSWCNYHMFIIQIKLALANKNVSN